MWQTETKKHRRIIRNESDVPAGTCSICKGVLRLRRGGLNIGDCSNPFCEARYFYSDGEWVLDPTWAMPAYIKTRLKVRLKPADYTHAARPFRS